MDAAKIAKALKYGFVAATVIAKSKSPWDALAAHWVLKGFRRIDLSQADSFFLRELRGPMSYHLAQTFLQGRMDAAQASNIDIGLIRANSLRQADLWARKYTEETTKGLLDTNASVLEHFVPKWIDAGLGQAQMAQRAKKLYGLDLRSAIAFDNYREAKNKGSMTDLFAKMLGQRGDIVGDVHSFTALNAGRQMLYSQAVAEGILPVKAKKVWLTAIDERVCKYCGPMDEVAVGVNANFNVPKLGKLMQPPAHPNCRCVTVPEKTFNAGMITRTARFTSDDNKLANLASQAKSALLG